MDTNIKSVIVIPARIDSKRLPKKILKNIGDEPLIKKVLTQCISEFKKKEIIICTDSMDVISLTEKWGYKSIITSNKCTSGTERISSALKEIIKYSWEKDNISDSEYINLAKKTLIINVQCDQPFLDPKILKKIKEIFLRSRGNKAVITPIYKLSTKDIENPNIVKVIRSQDGLAIYFSRAPIPFNRDQNIENWTKYNSYWGHVGVYGFRGDIVSKWDSYPESKLEDIEALEQLRLIYAGVKINTFVIDNNSFSIDTYDQLIEARQIWNNIVKHRINS